MFTIIFLDKSFSKSQIDIIQKFRQMHLQQQSAERRFLDDRKHLALSKLDEFGNPLNALFFIDGMTQYTCHTPKFKQPSKGDKSIESRIIGVEVYCGPIKTVFVYRTDSLVSSGSNIMAEVLRQSMIDLCKLLKDRQLSIPPNLWLQFDNCGENKNKEMFCYLSMLIELMIFKEVEIGFLIVGHTHASIDQYFSVISKKIFECEFIASPLALLELIRLAHKSSWDQDPVVREISVYYDLISFFTPYRNKKIKYYAIPHYFILKQSLCGIAYMQYKLFSTYSELLPPLPNSTIRDIEELAKSEVHEILVPNGVEILGGHDAILKHILVTDGGSYGDKELNLNHIVTNKSKVAILNDINRLLCDLNNLCNLSARQKCRRMEWESEEELLVTSTASASHGRVMQRDVVKITGNNAYTAIQSENSKESGYICWLLDSNGRVGLPPINEVKPKAYDPKDILDTLDDSSGKNARLNDALMTELIMLSNIFNAS